MITQEDEDRLLDVLARGAASVDDAEIRAKLRADPTIPAVHKLRLERFWSKLDAVRAEAK